MLVAVLMIFVVFSYTSVAVLHISNLSSSTSGEIVNSIKLQYAMESSVNKTLWRINNSPDSLVNMNADGITTVWDASNQVLSVNINKFEMETELLLDLSGDTHFDRALAADETIEMKNGQFSGPIVGNSISLQPGEDFENHINFRDAEHPHHFRCHKGFKSKKHYDRPEQIGRWNTKTWKGKHNQA